MTRTVISSRHCSDAQAWPSRLLVLAWAALALGGSWNTLAGVIYYSHDAAGRLTLAAYTNGASHAYSYDTAGNLLQRTSAAPGASVPELDSDHDGLPDAWEVQYFGNLSRDGSGDFDSDGFSDLAEFLLGTDPASAASGLRIIPPPIVSTSGVTVVWTAVPPRTYRLQFSSSLATGWTDVAGDVTAIASTAQKFDSTAIGQPARFYRVLLVTAGTPADSDGDGLLDAWELQYFSTLARDGNGDFDNDGFRDSHEFLAGTLPNDADSALRIFPDPGLNGGGAVVTWRSVVDKIYRLQFKDSLSETNWQNVTGDVAATNSITAKLDATTTNSATRFYRVMLVP